jgi:hypothetical protein
MSALGQKRIIEARPRNVRFTPKSGHQFSALRCPLCANSGHQLFDYLAHGSRV